MADIGLLSDRENNYYYGLPSDYYLVYRDQYCGAELLTENTL